MAKTISAVLSSFLLGANLLQGVLAATVPIPDLDSFYQPPTGFASSKPGTVFKHRSAPSGISGVTATQILYRTNDANLKAAATVATILVGPKSSPSKLVSYQDYEDAVNTTCSPSYLLNTGNGNAPFGPTGGSEVSSGLANGWTIIIPDYEGFTSSFAAGHLEGYAVLDGFRAALGYAPLKISKTAVLGGLGYSGGAIATGWAAALHASYAPELNIKGWSMGGTPANTTAVLQTVDGGFFAGFGAGGTSGLISAYPTLKARVAQIITPAGKAALLKITSQCALADLTSFAFQTLQSTQYQTLGSKLLYDPTIVAVLKKNVLGSNKTETPKAPVFMFHSTKDEVIPYAAAKAAAAAWCKNGASVNFTSETGGSGHLGAEAAIGQYGIDWLDLRIRGIKPTAGCSSLSVSVGGLPLKRAEPNTKYIDSDVLDRFGYGDEKVIAKMLSQKANGEPVDSFWSYLRNGKSA